MLLQTLNTCKRLFAGMRTKGDSADSENRRRYRRRTQCKMLTIQLLDDDMSGTGRSAWGVSRDISRGGIGFTHSHPIDANFLRITIQESGEAYLAEVRHSRMLDETTWFSGVEFVEPIDYSSQA